jgi:BirA family biotin operon repressor/biotin-[acetyl-CoA-carboxylase] ligase
MMRSNILDLLRKAGDEYISGEEIASKLGVSRTAVWKHIKELKQAGYLIDSHSRSGYCLKETPDLLLPGEIENGRKTKVLGNVVKYYKSVLSTNNEAKKLAAQGAADGTIIVSEEQSTGRGRLSRGWYSPEGKGIWFTIILRPNFLPQEAPKCTLMAAVALAKAVKKFGLDVGIKWPNDILYEGKKLVGILTEMNAEMDRVNYIIIGMGINVNIARDDFPDEIKDLATSFSIMKGERLPRLKILNELLYELENLYEKAQTDGFVPILEEWKKYSVTLGQEVNVIGINETFAGKAVDIDDDGALLVETTAGIRRVLAGDVSIRPRK